MVLKATVLIGEGLHVEAEGNTHAPGETKNRVDSHPDIEHQVRDVMAGLEAFALSAGGFPVGTAIHLKGGGPPPDSHCEDHAETGADPAQEQVDGSPALEGPQVIGHLGFMTLFGLCITVAETTPETAPGGDVAEEADQEPLFFVATDDSPGVVEVRGVLEGRCRRSLYGRGRDWYGDRFERIVFKLRLRRKYEKEMEKYRRKKFLIRN